MVAHLMRFLKVRLQRVSLKRFVTAAKPKAAQDRHVIGIISLKKKISAFFGTAMQGLRMVDGKRDGGRRPRGLREKIDKAKNGVLSVCANRSGASQIPAGAYSP